MGTIIPYTFGYKPQVDYIFLYRSNYAVIYLGNIFAAHIISLLRRVLKLVIITCRSLINQSAFQYAYTSGHIPLPIHIL